MSEEPRTYPACKGKNCGCTDGISHSAECLEEHARVSSPKCPPMAIIVDHRPPVGSLWRHRASG